jgi:hypothetical protein
MEFLDPKKQRNHVILILVGYVAIGIAILFATRLLLLESYGYGLNGDGQLIQSGIVFVSSVPSGAQIHLNNATPDKTHARLSVVSGEYTMQLTRTGYRSWQRTISVDGGTVQHYDYPFLFPSKLVTTNAPDATYDSAPGVVSQSPDLRWLLVQQPGNSGSFNEYDFNNPKLKPVVLTLPESIIGTDKTHTLEAIDWSNDNQHLLLKDTDSDGKVSFILFDRSDPAQSVDLSTTFNVATTTMSFLNGKYNSYYLYDTTAQTLSTANLGTPTVTPLLDHVLDYKPQDGDVLLYVSSEGVPSGKVAIDLFQAGKTYELRTAAANDRYLLNLSSYAGSLFVAVGSSSENKVYVYKNPVDQLNSKAALLVPIYVLKAKNPNYVSFSGNSRFVMSENGSSFAVYDAENDKGYLYDTKTALDAPQTHATWMDGHRLQYVSAGKLVVFDFDSMNQQTLMPASPSYLPFFDPNYKFVDTFVPDVANPAQFTLTSTALRTPADQ